MRLAHADARTGSSSESCRSRTRSMAIRTVIIFVIDAGGQRLCASRSASTVPLSASITRYAAGAAPVAPARPAARRGAPEDEEAARATERLQRTQRLRPDRPVALRRRRHAVHASAGGEVHLDDLGAARLGQNAWKATRAARDRSTKK